MREVLTIPNGILRQKCSPVEEIDSTIKALAEEMVELLGQLHKGLVPVGIAAPQLGVPLRMFAYRANPYSDIPDTRVAINPVLTLRGRAVQLVESCLSVPGRKYLVRRHKIVKLKCIDIHGEHHSYRVSGIVAQVFQHECNHLDGILIDEVGVLV